MTSTTELRFLETCVFLQAALHAVTYLLQGVQHFKTPIYITPSRASKSAIKAIEDNGGKVVCKFYNPLALRDCVKGRTDRVSAAPTRREDISEFLGYYLGIQVHHPSPLVWYGRHRNRGFISPGTLKSLGDLPFVEERWKLLATQLGAWKKQEFDVQKKK